MTEKRIVGKTNQSPPWEMDPATLPEVAAIRAIVNGEATGDQQRLFVKWLEKATAVGELEFRANSERESNFAAGKRFVGLQFFILAKTFLADPKQG